MQKISIRTGNTKDSVKRAIAAINRWGKKGNITACINYDASKINPNNPKTYPLQIQTGDVRFYITDVSAGYRGIGPLGTIEILKALDIPVNDQEIFSCSYKEYKLYKEENIMKYSEVAAKWWKDRLLETDFSKYNNGEKSDTSDILSKLAVARAKYANVSEESLNEFVKKLSNEIENEIEHYGNTSLCSDYGPTDLLLKVANYCNVPVELFPWKTIMRITRSEISVYVNGKKEVIFKV